MKRFTVLLLCATTALAAPAFALQQDWGTTENEQDGFGETCGGMGELPNETYEPPKTIEYADFDQVVSIRTSFLPEVQHGGRELQFD